MKKLFSFKAAAILLVLLLSVALVVGCGGQDNDPVNNEDNNNNENNDNDAAPVETTNLLMSTGGTAGTYYPLGGAIAAAWSNHIEGLNVTTESTGASVENMRNLDSKRVELVMAMNNQGTYAFEGSSDNFPTPVEGFSAIGNIYPEVLQIVARADSGIKTIADLKGKRVAIGPAGSGTAAAAPIVLAAYGLTLDDIDDFTDTFGDAADKMRDGQIDAAFGVLSVPAGSIIDMATAFDVTIVNIEPDKAAEIGAIDPTFSPYEIPANTYGGQTEIGYTISNWATLYVLNDVDEELVYQMTKIMYEKASEIASAHDAGSQILIETATDGIAPVPFHPGAQRYYDEVK